MKASLLTTTGRVKRGLTPKLVRLKGKLRRQGVTTWQIAVAADVTDAYVWMVLNGRRRSPRILEAAERLLAEQVTKNTAESKAGGTNGR